MAALLLRTGSNIVKNTIFNSSIRSISSTKPLNLKEIREQRDGDTITVEGIAVPSPRSKLLVRAENLVHTDLVPVSEPLEKPSCYMCKLGLDLKHTDVLILSQFLRSDGCMLPRRITGLCRRQQKKMSKLVAMSLKAGLMINMTPNNCKKDPTKRKDYKKFNTYFDERTIFMKKIPDQSDKFKR